jgi:hypothetical protein
MKKEFQIKVVTVPELFNSTNQLPVKVHGQVQGCALVPRRGHLYYDGQLLKI